MYNIEYDALEKHFTFSSPVTITIEDIAIESVHLTKLNEEFIGYIANKAIKLFRAYKRDLVDIEEVVDMITSMINEYDTSIYCNERGSIFCENMTGYCSLLLTCNETGIDLRDDIYTHMFKKYEKYIEV